ncbi:MAG: Hsp20/alpha crystallin family protein [Acidimicrobiales bacterium]
MPTRYVPLSSFGRMEQLVDGLLSPTRTAPRHDRQIPVDAVMGEGELALYFDLPGVAPDAVELAIERRVLSVRADRAYTPREGEQVFFAERPWGQFSRQIVLSDTLDTNRVNASFDNGVLVVTIPVAEQAQSRRIEVTHAPLRTDSHEVSAAPEGPTGSSRE